MPDFPELAEARVLSLRPGDIIVLRANAPVSRDSMERIAAYAEKHFKFPVIVLEDFQIDVIRKEEQ